ncbi:MAG: CoA transferase [Actinomycetota bacterium]|nr:CoA transferase [Acidimicrobiales bacterium]MEE2807312.1 CoA transferase [Actinomycetota bacterium]|tara:strand:- start:12022 stop:13149 length:1128 start_codon:yes stop_codon:yes gene_type:complete
MAGPYNGVRVIDTTGLAGAYATRLFAGLGAEVIRLESPEGSPLRALAPFVESIEPPENSLWWSYLGMGTRSVVVEPGDKDSLAQILSGADVVFEDRLPEDSPITSDLVPDNAITTRIVPFGLTGPKRSWKSSNLVAWAASGVLYATGFRDRAPVAPAGHVQLALHASAASALVGTLLALRARRKSGKGQQVEISMQEAALTIAPETGVPVFLDDRVHRERSGNRRDLGRPFGLYPCSDGFVSIIVLMPRHWTAMAEWVAETTGNETIAEEVFQDLTVRMETQELIDTWVEELTTGQTRLALFEEGQRRGIPITPVNTVNALVDDPHLKAANYWSTTQLADSSTVTVPGAPFRTDSDWWTMAPAPLLGQHTEFYLA